MFSLSSAGFPGISQHKWNVALFPTYTIYMFTEMMDLTQTQFILVFTFYSATIHPCMTYDWHKLTEKNNDSFFNVKKFSKDSYHFTLDLYSTLLTEIRELC